MLAITQEHLHLLFGTRIEREVRLDGQQMHTAQVFDSKQFDLNYMPNHPQNGLSQITPLVRYDMLSLLRSPGR